MVNRRYRVCEKKRFVSCSFFLCELLLGLEVLWPSLQTSQKTLAPLCMNFISLGYSKELSNAFLKCRGKVTVTGLRAQRWCGPDAEAGDSSEDWDSLTQSKAREGRRGRDFVSICMWGMCLSNSHIWVQHLGLHCLMPRCHETGCLPLLLGAF